MTPQTTLPDHGSGQLGAEGGQTRSAFVDTLEAMEDGFKDAMHGADDAVSAAGDAANDTMEATGKAVRDGARGAANAFAWALDVPGHVSRHPWVALGVGILAGLVLVRFCRRR